MSIYSACAPLHTLSMSSREIAALTGKRHDNIMRDIRVMLNHVQTGRGLAAEVWEDASNR